MAIILVISVLFLSFSNGSNDTFKGVATLLGSKTATYKICISWATLMTAIGCIAAIFFAQKLATNFSGKGLVSDQIVHTSSFSISVALAAAFTIALATRFGFPISTTHALTGSLVGVGILASPTGIVFDKLISTFLLPLILSPLIAVIAAIIVYVVFNYIRNATRMMTATTCEQNTVDKVFTTSEKPALKVAHFLSAGFVSFARGLNDAPKIVAIILVSNSISKTLAFATVTFTMAIGGLILSKNIAKKMSFEITELDALQGFSSNFITGLIVIAATYFGMPVSTTHVSCGSLFGIGAVTKNANWNTILKIIFAWLITLPVSAIFGSILYLLFSQTEIASTILKLQAQVMEIF